MGPSLNLLADLTARLAILNQGKQRLASFARSEHLDSIGAPPRVGLPETDPNLVLPTVRDILR
jgi:hypothetical protein